VCPNFWAFAGAAEHAQKRTVLLAYFPYFEEIKRGL
jgi:hypothetical protein